MKFGRSARKSKAVVDSNLQQDDKEDEPLRFRSVQSMVREQNNLVSPVRENKKKSVEDALGELESSFSSARESSKREKRSDAEPRQPRRVKSLVTASPSKSSSKSSSKLHEESIKEEQDDDEMMPRQPRRVQSMAVKSKSKRKVVEKGNDAKEEERPKLRRAQSQAARSGVSKSKRNLLEKEEKVRQQLRRVQSQSMGSKKSSSSSSRHLDDRSISSSSSSKPRKSKSMMLGSKSSSSRSLLERSSSKRSSKLSKSKSFTKSKSLSRIRLDEGEESDGSIQLLHRKDKSFVKKDDDDDDDMSTSSRHSTSSRRSSASKAKRRSSKVQTSAGPVSKAELMKFLASESSRSVALDDSSRSVGSTRSSKSEKRKLKKQRSSRSFKEADYKDDVESDDEETAAISLSSSERREQEHRNINQDSVNKILAESIAREIFADEHDLECGVSELDDSSGSYRHEKSGRGYSNSLFYLNEKTGTMGDGLVVVDLLGDAEDYHPVDHPETCALVEEDDYVSSTMYKMLRSRRHRRCLCLCVVFLLLLTVFSMGLAFGLYQKSQA